MEDLINLLYKRIPFYSTLGFKLKEIQNGKAIFELMLRKELMQNGMVHGGVLASMIDSTCACAAYSLIYPEGYITTIDLQVAYLKPVSEGRLIAEGLCIKSGKKIFFCESKIWNQQEDLICTGTSQLLFIKD